ncbi:MAG TPA: DUF2779 domain-containing protein [Phycisphaerae bacterium]|nr:DUF2779 domain-containing protein [Phycisphaerae bacterium]
MNVEAAAKQTALLMLNEDVTTIFEACFNSDGYTARADILCRISAGWHLIEVKSDVNDSPELLDDLSYTAMVMNKCGVKIAKASLLLLSKEFRLGMPNSKLFVEVDHTAQVQERVVAFSSQWPAIRDAILGPTKPEAKLTWICKNCGFFEQDCVGHGIKDHIFDLPRLRDGKFSDLMQQGFQTIHQIPANFALTEKQSLVRSCVQQGRAHITEAIATELAKVSWPAYYLDFETLMAAIPFYENVAPYTQVPTQYSIHVCSAPGIVTGHHEFLADPARDCREELAKQLIADAGTIGSIVAYHAAFEKTVINALAANFPALATSLLALTARIIDLEAILIASYYHPDFRGSYSIKVTLPVLVPAMRYDGLAIGDGDTAVAMFARMAQGKCSAEETAKIRSDLLTYCKQDTLAMVKLHERLVALSPA